MTRNIQAIAYLTALLSPFDRLLGQKDADAKNGCDLSSDHNQKDPLEHSRCNGYDEDCKAHISITSKTDRQH